MEKCVKCKKTTEGGGKIVYEGVAYPFCIECMKTLEKMPTGWIREYLDSDTRENWVKRNIRIAKKRREEGKGAWTCC